MAKKIVSRSLKYMSDEETIVEKWNTPGSVRGFTNSQKYSSWGLKLTTEWSHAAVYVSHNRANTPLIHFFTSFVDRLASRIVPDQKKSICLFSSENLYNNLQNTCINSLLL